ncbi:MAG: HlyD family efflux transporter periplasmic adaptor subunit [Prevotellaceae bacterium]|jgi:hypothetical protein|nr:HlyD family efflux transporter periplasmic adaptor subunit [Prevotellaceae bacterium]
MNSEKKNIELRSEKVRNIIGKVPPVFIRYGIGIVAVSLLVLFVISIIIPYRETVKLSITVHSKPNADLIKSTHSGTVIIDTSGSQKDSVQAYLQTANSIDTICKCAVKNILFSVNNKQFVSENEILFIVNSTDNYEIFGIADITKDDTKKIHKGQTVNIIADDMNVEGTVSDIYAINPEQTRYRLKINISVPNNMYFDSKYQGIITVSEKSLFLKIFGK